MIKRRVWITTVVFALVVAGGFYVTARIRVANAAAGKTQYKVATAELGTVKKTVSATGTLQPWSTVDIKSKAGGRVDALLVDVGSVVKKNQVLARIDPSDTQLSVQTAKAGIDTAEAHKRQSEVSYQLQTKQSRIAIDNAQASLQAALANRAAAASRLVDAQSQSGAQPAQTRASIAQAQANYNQAVKQRKLLDATDLQDRAAAKSAYDQAVANENNAKTSLSRQASLLSKGFVAQQTVDSAQASYDVYAAQTQSALEKMNTLTAEQQANTDAADARVAQAKAALQSAKAGAVDIATKRNAVTQAQAALKQADAQVSGARVALEQAKADQANNALKLLDIAASQASIKSNEATYKNAATTLSQTTVRAPTDGVVLQKYVSQGTIITSGLSLSSTGTSIVQIGDVTRMYVQATVDETDLANVDVGQNVDVTFDAYPGIPFEGKAVRIDPLAVVNQNVTQYNVRVEIDNSSPTFRLLKPGMNATCDFVASKKDDVLSVPNEAVQTDDQGSYVQVAKGGRPAPADPSTGMPADPSVLIDVQVRRQPVQVGLVGNETTEVTGGLQAGAKVVTEKIEPAPPTPAAGSSPFAGGRGFGGGRGGGGRR